jgi:PAS domain S-box-containing protein
MKLDFRAAHTLSAVAAAVVIAFMGWLLWNNMSREQVAQGWVRHASEVLRTVTSIRESVARMESAKRAYLLSGDPQFLVERDEAVVKLRQLTRDARDFTQHSAEHHAAAVELARVVEQRLHKAVDNGRPPPASLPAVIADAHQATLAVYRTAQLLQDEEAQELARRKLQRETESVRGPIVLGGLVLVCIALLVPAYLAALRQSRGRQRAEQRMADIVENLPLTVWQLRSSTGGRREFVYVSPNAAADRGLDAERLQRDYGALLASVLDEQRDEIAARQDAAERSSEGYEATYRARGEDGRVRWVHSRARLRPQADGSILWSGFWRDVTREKELEQALREANRELESFSYSVSHDLRSPIAAVTAFTTALLGHEGSTLSPRGRLYAERVLEAAAQMRELIQGLLMLSRLSTQIPRSEAVDLTALASQLADQLRHAYPERGVAFAVEPGLHATGDPSLLRQVLANLLENAWKFTGRTPQPRVEVGASSEGGRPHFFVRDNGVGFDAANADRLFQPFNRFHKAADFPGTGIGLATVMRIVARHGGDVWCDAAPGRGACFRFTLAAHSGTPLDASRTLAEASAAKAC